jgi:hypothetical protein
MLQDLVRHKGYANASLLKAIRQHKTAAQDQELRRLLHHIIVADRFWLRLTLGHPFAHREESLVAESLDAITVQYRKNHAQELEWLYQAHESQLARMLETPFIPGAQFFSGSSADAGLHAQPWSPRAVRDQAAIVGWHASCRGFHSLVEGAPGPRLVLR